MENKTPQNKKLEDLIGPYKIRRKGKYILILKTVTMIHPVTGWCEITQCNNNKAMTIENLVETMWLARLSLASIDNLLPRNITNWSQV